MTRGGHKIESLNKTACLALTRNDYAEDHKVSSLFAAHEDGGED